MHGKSQCLQCLYERVSNWVRVQTTEWVRVWVSDFTWKEITNMIYIHKIKHCHSTTDIKTWRFESVNSFSSDAVKNEMNKVFTTSDEELDEFATLCFYSAFIMAMFHFLCRYTILCLSVFTPIYNTKINNKSIINVRLIQHRTICNLMFGWVKMVTCNMHEYVDY